jgi:hypothetical protein
MLRTQYKEGVIQPMDICGKEVRVRGRLIRTAYIDGEGFQFVDDPETALCALRESGTRVDLFTFIQRLSETSPKYAYPMEWDNMAVLRISTFEQWWKEQIGFKARNKAKQAEKKGVDVREAPFDDALIRGIHAINNETPVRQGRRFHHYGEDIETVRKITGTFLDRSVFIGAFFGGELIGFVKLVANEDWTQAGLMHILSRIDQRDKAPTNALVAQAVRSCADRGIPNLWYANFSYGRKQHSSLSDFKERNGFRKVEVPRFYIPLTVAGRVALRLGFHRSLLDWIPGPVAVAYRRVRLLWYATKHAGFEGT